MQDLSKLPKTSPKALSPAALLKERQARKDASKRLNNPTPAEQKEDQAGAQELQDAMQA